LLFWDAPFFSLVVYLAVTGIFWKFVSFYLHKLALVIIIVASPLSINELRNLIFKQLKEKHGFVLKTSKRKLPLTLDNVCSSLADAWIILEGHYEYLFELKDKSSATLSIWLAFYFSMTIITFVYIPLANILYTAFHVVYFYPLMTYTNFPELFLVKMNKILNPIIVHWQHNKTKRKRDCSKPRLNSKGMKSSSDEEFDNFSNDSENDSFLPETNFYTEKLLKSAVPAMRSESCSSKNESFDDGCSDYDADSFLPSERFGIDEPLPSMSQFDSLMEPIDDEFHAGLNFNEVKSVSSRFGIPMEYQKETENKSFASDDYDTDNEIEELPLEQTDFLKPQSNYFDDNNIPSNEVKEDTEYEMLEKSELLNVTDEELNQEINSGKNSKSISNLLGY